MTKRRVSADPTIIEPGSPGYPGSLRIGAGCGHFSHIWVMGDAEILKGPLLALLCSTRCPGRAIVQAYDVARALRDAGVPVISGFHTPMEKECLDLLLRESQPVVVCPARSIQSMRIPAGWKLPLVEGRLLVLSPFEVQHRRPTAELAAQRNRVVTAIAHSILLVYAAPSSTTERLSLELLKQGKPVYLLDGESNSKLLAAGALVRTVETIGMLKQG